MTGRPQATAFSWINVVARNYPIANPLTGNQVLSFLHWFFTPGNDLFTPSELVEFDGSASTLYLDGTLLPDGLNLDAAHILDNGELLVNFDVDAELPGISGSYLTRDDDVVWIDRTTGQVINVVLSMSDADASWFPVPSDRVRLGSAHVACRWAAQQTFS